MSPLSSHASVPIIGALAREFTGVLSGETIAVLVTDAAHRYDNAVYTAFIPTLVHRSPRGRLLATAHLEGPLMKTKPSVLFVCVHNAGRSQMAAALLDHYAQGRVEVRSAGSAPAATIHQGVKEAMAAQGISLDQAFPKPLTAEIVETSDVVVTMGCGDACPVYPGKRYLDWELDDPAGRSLEDVRPIRDEIDRRVRALLGEVISAPTV